MTTAAVLACEVVRRPSDCQAGRRSLPSGASTRRARAAIWKQTAPATLVNGSTATNTNAEATCSLTRAGSRVTSPVDGWSRATEYRYGTSVTSDQAEAQRYKIAMPSPDVT